jgi:DNA gyrase/topoisomerase IV subunit A
LSFSRNGYGKATATSDYKTQNRGGSGIKTMNITPKTGPVIAARIITKEEGVGADEIVVVSKKGQIIRTGLAEIPRRPLKLREGDRFMEFLHSRSGSASKLMKLREGDAV